MKAATLAQARAAKEKLSRAVASRQEVNGVGITRAREGYAVKLNLSKDVGRDALPMEVDGVPVQVEIIGPISKRRPNAGTARASKKSA